MILKFKLLGSSVDAWEAPLEPVLLLVFRVLTNSKNKLISSNLSFVIPFNQIHDRASFFNQNKIKMQRKMLQNGLRWICGLLLMVGMAVEAEAQVVQAETATTLSGVSSRTGSNSNGGYLDYGGANTYAQWTGVSAGGTGTLTLRYTVGSSTRKLKLAVNGTNYGTKTLGFTGNPAWSTWATVTWDNVSFAGSNTIRLTADGASGPNIDEFTISASGIIQAESYTSQFGTSTANTNDADGGLYVGWINSGDWLVYNTINIPEAGDYKIQYRISSPSSNRNVQLQVKRGGRYITLGTADVPNTGGWQTWRTVSHTVHFDQTGVQEFRIYFPTTGININWWSYEKVSIDLASHSESFESNLGDWVQATNDDMNWARRTGSTPSSGTGPSDATNGTSYLYVEASSPNANKKAFLEQIIDTKGYNLKLKFDYHMYSKNRPTDMGRLGVVVLEGSSRYTLFQASKSQGNQWKEGTIDLSMYQGKTIKIVFEATVGDHWQGDIAIDNIRLEDNGMLSTNPDAPYVPLDKRKLDANGNWVGRSWQINKFDWTQKESIGNSNATLQEELERLFGEVPSNPKGVIIEGGNANAGQEIFPANPFYGNPLIGADKAVNAQGVTVQMLWQDGWELVKQNLGYKADGTPLTGNSYGNFYLMKKPYIILYNRYTGILRVLVLYTNPNSTFNRVNVWLEFPQEGESSHLLGATQGYALESQALQKYVVTSNSSSTGSGYNWTYADFPVAFDPCAQDFTSSLKVSFETVAEGTVALEGRQVGTQRPASSSFSLSPEKFLVGAAGGDNLGHFVFTDIGDVANQNYSNIGTLETPTGSRSTATVIGEVSSGLTAVDGLLKLLTTTTGVAPALTALTWGATFMNTQSRPPSFDQDITLPAPQPYVSFAQLKLNGSVSRVTQGESFLLATPGSGNSHVAPEYGSQQSTAIAPIYNQTLGVFNLVNQPKINMYLAKSGTGRITAVTAKMTEPIYYTVNDKLDIDWDKSEFLVSIKVSSEIDLENHLIVGPYNINEQTKLNDDLMNDFYIGIRSRSTGQYDIIDHPTPSERLDGIDTRPHFFQSMYITPDNPLTSNNNYVRVKSKSNGNEGALRYSGYLNNINSWDLLYEDENRGVSIISGDGSYLRNNASRVDLINSGSNIAAYMRDGDETAFKNNISFTLVVQAKIVYRTLDRDGNQNVSFQQYSFPAKTTTVYGTINRETSILTGPLYNLFGSNYYVNSADVRNHICNNSNRYKSIDVSNLRKRDLQEESEHKTIKQLTSLQVNAYPNPTQGKINFDFALPEAGEGKLVLYNIMGQAVMVIAEGQMNGGINQVSADVSGLDAGIYIYRLETSQGEPTSGRIVVR
jgi:hypothetical protein